MSGNSRLTARLARASEPEAQTAQAPATVVTTTNTSPQARCDLGEDRRYQKTAGGAPSREARKRHLIEAAPSLGQREDRGERDPTEEPE